MDWSKFTADPGWEIFGMCGQLMFGSRFLYQWFVSERAKRSIVPVGFWYLSIAGTSIVFIYALHMGSIAFMIPTLTGLPVYIRNLVLIRRRRKAGEEA